VLYLVVRRRIFPPTIEDYRETLKRSEDVDVMALNLSQLIEQRGARGWVDPLMERLGPKMLLKLEDFTDTLEIMEKYVPLFLSLCNITHYQPGVIDILI